MNFEEFLLKYQKKKVVSFTEAQVKKPLVSVCVQTYQHQDYILECLNSIINQKVNFEYEILIGEDCSCDGTLKLCKEFAIKHKKIVTLFSHDRINNISINGAPSGRFNMLFNLFSAKGKYIALCEGDDYWTDPLKLQKQVEFLEANKGCVLSIHNSRITNLKREFIRNFNEEKIIEFSDVKTVLNKKWYIPTASMVFRNNIAIPNWFVEVLNGDYAIVLLLASNGGLIHYDKTVMSSYRLHQGGVSNIFRKRNTWYYAMLNINKYFNNYTSNIYYAIIKQNVFKYSYEILISINLFSKEYFKVLRELIVFNKGLSLSQLLLLSNDIHKRIKMFTKKLFRKMKSKIVK